MTKDNGGADKPNLTERIGERLSRETYPSSYEIYMKAVYAAPDMPASELIAALRGGSKEDSAPAPAQDRIPLDREREWEIAREYAGLEKAARALQREKFELKFQTVYGGPGILERVVNREREINSQLEGISAQMEKLEKQVTSERLKEIFADPEWDSAQG